MRRQAGDGLGAAAHFEIPADEPVYVIGVVSTLVRIPVWTLRALDREGIVRARRNSRNRLYSLKDLQLLMRIRHWMVEERVNLRGVRVILQMQEKGG